MSLVAVTSAVDCLDGLVSKTTRCVSSRLLNCTYSRRQSLCLKCGNKLIELRGSSGTEMIRLLAVNGIGKSVCFLLVYCFCSGFCVTKAG